MTLPRKEQAKIDYLNSLEGQALRQSVNRHDIPLDQVSDEILPDDFEFDGLKIAHGQICRTAGEYKAILEKHKTDWIYW